MIKNLVLSACGPNLVTMLGILHELHNQNYWNLKDIEAFYGTSGGTVIAVFILLCDDFDTLKDYIIKRPWNTVWPIEPNIVFNMYKNMGLFSIDTFYKVFEPFFKAKNMNKEITLKEFYDITKKTIYFYITELNNFEVFYVNHETHPTMGLIEAVYKSSSVPGIFVPIIEDDKCYVDGGLLNYFPTKDALANAENNSILGLCNDRSGKHNLITNNSNLVDFLTTLLSKTMDFVINSILRAEELNNVIIVPGFVSNDLWLEIVSNKNKREEMYNIGITTAQTFMREKLEKAKNENENKNEKNDST